MVRLLMFFFFYKKVRLLMQIYQVPSSFGMSKVSTTQEVIPCLFNYSCSFRLIRQCTLLGRLYSTLTSFLFFFSHQHVTTPVLLSYITIGKNKKITALLFERFRSSFILSWQKGTFKLSNFKGICISMAIMDSMPIIWPRLPQRRK